MLPTKGGPARPVLSFRREVGPLAARRSPRGHSGPGCAVPTPCSSFSRPVASRGTCLPLFILFLNTLWHLFLVHLLKTRT